ncbi:hypothetical protein JTB14_003979 [Gonioctena quinquepunctata]|nr:hypothetical protein JTB14_003979 [Gonioctena quinquepunctata]
MPKRSVGLNLLLTGFKIIKDEEKIFRRKSTSIRLNKAKMILRLLFIANSTKDLTASMLSADWYNLGTFLTSTYLFADVARDDNLNACGWKKDCTNIFAENCNDYVSTEPHLLRGTMNDISGRGIINPRIVIIRRGELLRTDETKKICRNLVKGYGDIKDVNGEKKFG